MGSNVGKDGLVDMGRNMRIAAENLSNGVEFSTNRISKTVDDAGRRVQLALERLTSQVIPAATFICFTYSLSRVMTSRDNFRESFILGIAFTILSAVLLYIWSATQSSQPKNPGELTTRPVQNDNSDGNPTISMQSGITSEHGSTQGGIRSQNGCDEPPNDDATPNPQETFMQVLQAPTCVSNIQQNRKDEA
jgi:hypothetical protein